MPKALMVVNMTFQSKNYPAVQQILANPDGPDVPRLVREIDQLVYALYGLTEEEIALVEGRK